MPQPSDSSYAAVSRFGRRPFGSGRPLGRPVWETLQDDDIQVDHPQLLDAEEEEAAPAGNSTAVSNHLLDRRRREENWADLGLDQILIETTPTAVPPLPAASAPEPSATR